MKFIQITRYQNGKIFGSYVQPLDQVKNAADGEFDCIEEIETGDKIVFECVEMSEAEYKNLPEFKGY